MRWLSRGVEQIQGKCKRKPDTPYDVIVIGSGYGGAVAAARFARAGAKVCVLERGREYVPGEFPNDWSLLPGHVRWNRADAADVQGERTGLFEIHTSRDALVLTGNALGGGSQINASVAMRADTRLFREPNWPREFRDSEETLDGYYSAAERMLEVTPYPGDDTAKFDALRTLSGLVAEAVKFADWTDTAPPATVFHPAPLAVTFASGENLAGVEQKACLRCGDCVTGCNFGAKNTLTMNYLPDAWRHGADMFSEVEVLAVLPRDGCSGARVYLRDARDDAEVVIDPLRVSPKADPPPRGISDCEWIEADFVVIAAGALGSTEILLRSRAFSAAFFSGEAAIDGLRRLRVSERLGAGFSGNGDGLGFGVEHRARINGVGLGAEAVAGKRYTVGPTITGVIDTRPGLPVAKGVLIEDGAIPRALARFFTEMAATSGSVAQLDRWSRKRDCADHAALPDGIAMHTQTYLMMGHDNADGRIVLRKGRATIQWPKAKAQPGSHRQHRLAALCERDGAVYVQNPTAKPVPDKLRAIFSGPAVEGPPIIVHPLGGCAMADRHADGVVNHLGEVFDGLGAETVVENLFVWDGSILPGSVGANPLLTIAALAERAAALVLKREGGITRNGRVWQPGSPIDLPAMPEVLPAAAPSAPVTSIEWRESMRGEIDFEGRPHAALLRVAFQFSDVADFVTRKSADIVIKPEFLADLRSRPPRRDVPLVQGAQHDREFFGLRVKLIRGKDHAAGDEDHAAGDEDHAARDFELVHGVVRLLDQSPRNPWLRALLLPFRYLRTLFIWFRKRRTELWANLQKLVLQWRQTLRDILSFLMSPLADTRADLDAAPRPVTLADRLSMHWRLVKHASDVRVMDYHLVFDGGQSQAGKTFVLKGRKTLRYSLHGNLWDDLMTLHLRCALVRHGSLKLDTVALAEGDRPRLHSGDDLPNALMRMAGLCAYCFRALFPPYIWDFRLPDYPSAARQRVTLPGRQPVVGIDGAVVAGAWIEPQRHWLMVPADQRDPLDPDDRFPSNALAPLELETSRLALLLTCFRSPLEANPKGPILLLHGFGQSSLGFGAHTIAVNLVQYLCAQGYEVWTLDYRTSTGLPHQAGRYTLDQVARIDIPLGVAEVCRLTGAKSIPVIGHCMGAAALAMALLRDTPLDGYYKQTRKVARPPTLRSRVSRVVLSQVPPFIIGGDYSQSRRQVAAFLRDVLQIDGIDLSADDSATMRWTVLDRVFATFPFKHKRPPDSDGAPEHEEKCPGEKALDIQTDTATCKRVQAIVGRTFLHANLSRESHAALGDYFGWCNIDIFNQIAKFFEYERLVDINGQNRYVTDANIAGLRDLPIQFLHGEENALFSKESAWRSHNQFSRINGGSMYALTLLPGLSHFDCLIGDRGPNTALGKTFPAIHEFLEKKFSRDGMPVSMYDLRPPLLGPIVGWTRSKMGKPVVTVWARADELRHGTAPVCGLTVLYARAAPQTPIQARFWRAGDPVFVQPRSVFGHRPVGLPAAVDKPLGPFMLARIVVPNAATDYLVRVAFVHGRQDDFVTRHDWLTWALGGANASQAPTGMLKRLEIAAWRPAEVSPVCGLTLNAADAHTALSAMDARFDGYARKFEIATRRMPSLERRVVVKKEESTAELRGRVLTAHLATSAQADASLRFLAGSCRYPGFLVDAIRGERAFDAMCAALDDAAAPAVAFALMAGDQIYADATAGAFDVNSAVEKFNTRYREAFDSPGFARLARRLPVYMTIDDHEFENDWDISRIDTARAPRRQDEWNKARSDAERAYALANWGWDTSHCYQMSHGPGGGIDRLACFTAGGFPVALFDTRSSRNKSQGGSSFGDTRALIEWLAAQNKETPKIIVSGSVFLPGIRDLDYGEWGAAGPAYPAHADNWQGFVAQRDALIDCICAKSINNVVFVSGDYHLSTIAEVKFKPGGGNAELTAWSIVVPPFYAPIPFAGLPASLVNRRGARTTVNGNHMCYATADLETRSGYADIRITRVAGAWQVGMTFAPVL